MIDLLLTRNHLAGLSNWLSRASREGYGGSTTSRPIGHEGGGDPELAVLASCMMIA